MQSVHVLFVSSDLVGCKELTWNNCAEFKPVVSDLKRLVMAMNRWEWEHGKGESEKGKALQQISTDVNKSNLSD